MKDRQEPSDQPPASPGRPGFVVGCLALFLSGFVALLVLRPQAMERTLESDNGPWLGGLTIGMVLGIGMLVVPLVLALTQGSRRP